MKKDKKVDAETLDNETENTAASTSGPDISALSEEEAKKMLSELIGENETLKAESELMKKELSAVKADADKNKDSWYRTAAEFENYKKRMQDVRKTSYDDGIKEAVTNLLSIGDSIDRALAVDLDEKTRAGVELVKRQFDESLTSLGVKCIDPAGAPFDAATAEAIATIPTDKEENNDMVAQVYKKGYELRGRMLRYAQVVVYKFQ